MCKKEEQIKQQNKELKEQLVLLYYDRKMSLPQIAESWGRSINFVVYWMDKFNLKRRTVSEAKLGRPYGYVRKGHFSRYKEFTGQQKELRAILKEQYEDSLLSTRQVAEMWGVCHQYISTLLKKYNLPIRTIAQALWCRAELPEQSGDSM